MTRRQSPPSAKPGKPTKSAKPSKAHNTSVTYAQAGVDIDAGNALVEAIKPLAKATRRPGADADLGGFGALFDLKRAPRKSRDRNEEYRCHDK